MVNSRLSARSALIAFHTSSGEAVASLSTRRMMSPFAMPRRAASEPGTTSATRTPPATSSSPRLDRLDVGMAASDSPRSGGTLLFGRSAGYGGITLLPLAARPLRNGYREGQLIVVALDDHVHRFTDRGPDDIAQQRSFVVRCIVAILQNHVADRHAGVLGGPARHDPGNDRTLRPLHAHRTRHVRRDLLDLDADPARTNPAVLHEPSDHELRGIGGDGEPQSGRGLGERDQSGVDTDDTPRACRTTVRRSCRD